MALYLTSKGSFKNTEAYLRKISKINVMGILNEQARAGVAALSNATPVETGRAAGEWGYEIKKAGGVYTVTWTNTDVENGFPVVIMLHLGYGTGTGGYVQGIDFINPAIRPIFDQIRDKIWKAVESA